MPLPEHDLIEPVERNAELAGSIDLADAKRLEVLLEQHLTRMDRWPRPTRLAA